MSIDLGTIGIWQRAAAVSVELAREAEDLGYGALWVGGSPAGHLQDVESVLDATRQIPVATGIVNIWRDDAATVSASYLRLEAIHPGRFLLGIGIGHPETTRQYRSPYQTTVAYLDVLDARGVPVEDRLLAALGPRMLRLSAQRTLGAHPYLTTPAHTAIAREVLGGDALLAPGHAVVLESDREKARETARPWVARYLRLVNYRNNLLREGWAEGDLADGGSDRLVDALVLHGEPEEIAAGVHSHIEAGADHVAVQTLGEDPIGTYRTLAEALIG